MDLRAKSIQKAFTVGVGSGVVVEESVVEKRGDSRENVIGLGC